MFKRMIGWLLAFVVLFTGTFVFAELYERDDAELLVINEAEIKDDAELLVLNETGISDDAEHIVTNETEATDVIFEAEEFVNEGAMVDSRLCTHGMWGIDILTGGNDGNSKWICHGSLSMDEYSQCADCDHNAAIPYTNEEENPSRNLCNLPGCNGTLNVITTHGPWTRQYQVLCTHRPWGVDIIESRDVIHTFKCSKCSYGYGSTQTETRTICYGFY